MTTLEIVDLPADQLPGDALLLPFFEDQRPLDGPAAVVDWRLDGMLTRMALEGKLVGRIGERLALQANAKIVSPWVLIGGGGRWRSLDRDSYLDLVDRLLKMASIAGIQVLALCLPPSDDIDARELERLVREALIGINNISVCRLSRVARFSRDDYLAPPSG
jgi:hypothetical protein